MSTSLTEETLAGGVRWLARALPFIALLASAEPPARSGIYPSLAMFNREGECGTGAVVPWAGRLWVITYGPHLPKGSTDKLYEVTPDLRQIIRPESIGGTPANRMIHRESQQLFIGPYAIDAQGGVRTIPYTSMFGRLTGLARHLTDPAGKICFATMEEGIYEVDVHTLAVQELWADEQRPTGRKAGLPGYHGKGFYSAQGRYLYANNGDHAREALTDPSVPSGVLAEWDGGTNGWAIVRRNQFTDVTGPGGIQGNPPGDDRAWSIGWDHRSLILMLLDRGAWHAYRLPKASHCYDGAHGWNTEWPRIREIGERDLLMTMHGSFWRFPATFSATNSSGIAPRSTYLKVVGDFCRWGDRVVLGCDDAAKSEFLNKHPLKGDIAGPDESQSNLWFIDPPLLDHLGPALGRGAVWVREDVAAGVPSDPFLFAGFAHRGLHLAHDGDAPVAFALEVDARGDGTWTPLRNVEVPAHGNVWTAFAANETGAWIRVTARTAARGATAFFSFRGVDAREPSIIAPTFSELAVAGKDSANVGLLHAHRGRTLRYATLDAGGQPAAAYDLDAELHLTRVDDANAAAETARMVAVPAPRIARDAASALYVEPNGRRWRLPVAEAAGAGVSLQAGLRACREVCTERNLLNTHGTFYELPADNAGGFAKIRPIATHPFAIHDFASYRGLLVMSGVKQDAASTDHLVHSPDGKASLWVGAVDDLWQLGKPRGVGGPWLDTEVAAGTPSDPYLMTGYDRKRIALSHDAAEPVEMTVQVDITGNGLWVDYQAFSVAPGTALRHDFPAAFSAYWVRVVSSRACRATAQLTYD